MQQNADAATSIPLGIQSITKRNACKELRLHFIGLMRLKSAEKY